MARETTEIINIENGMFQYFMVFHLPEKYKIHTQLLDSTQRPQNHTKQKINSNNTNSYNTNSHRKVRFSDKSSTKIMHVWQFAHAQARKGEWQQFSIDRMHFNSRIHKLNEIISPVLLKKYGEFIKNS